MWPLGIQSYCFRVCKDIPSLIDMLQKAGLDRVELYPGHLPVDGDDTDEQLARLRDAGIQVHSYGVIGFGSDAAQNERILTFAKQTLGLDVLSADIKPDADPQAIDEQARAVRVRNHGSKHHLGSTEQLDTLFRHVSDNVGLCIDSAWALEAGEDPNEWAKRWGDRLYGVHLKDFDFSSGEREDVVVGTGSLDLPTFLGTLREVGFQGYLSLEYEGDPEDPLPAVSKCVQVVREALGAVA